MGRVTQTLRRLTTLAGGSSPCWAVVLGLLTSMTVQAQISVNASGGVSYSHPIAVPPGISGMQPNFSLAFAGGGVNGPVGYGWSLQGVSMITRCPSTQVVDVSTKGVMYLPSDHLCLDGQRLIQTDASGSPKAFPQTDDALGLSTTAVREYRTENDTFARIRAYGASGANAANGPEYFRVWTKAGQIYDYGAPPASVGAKILVQGKSIVMVWAVSRISDVVGNYIDFRYEQRDIAWGSGSTAGVSLPGREWNLAEVHYTGNGAQLPANKVVFNYVDRPTTDRSEAYQRGSKNVSVRLLNSIDTFVNITGTATRVRTVKLGYQSGPVTKRNRLTTITECTGATTSVCQPPVRFNYASGASDAFTPVAAFNLATTALHQKELTASVVTIDFNGDGRTDLLYYDQNPALNRLYRSNGDGSFTQQPIGIAAGQFNITGDILFSPSGCFSSLLIDFDADGLTDILRVAGTACGGDANTKLFRNKGDGSFEKLSIVGVSLSAQAAVETISTEAINVPGVDGWVSYLIDVDGDGRIDVVRALAPTSEVCPNAICTWVYKGDGLGNFTVMPATSISGQRLYRYVDPKAPLEQQRYVADLDGDGLQDLVLGKASGNYGGTWRSLGNGNFEPYIEPTDALQCHYRIDFNGDGRGECLYPSGTATSNRLTLSTGSALVNASSFNLNTSTGDALGPAVGGSIIVDFNGDGRGDILRWLDDPTRNLLFLSNGDGSFTKSTSFNLTTADSRLKSSDGVITFVMGDFTGRGGLEILRLRKQVLGQTGAANENRLFDRGDLNPPDTLLSVVSPSGLKTTINYESLTSLASNPVNSSLDSRRYYSDRSAGVPSVYPLVDLTLPMRVVASTDVESGVGAGTVSTQYAYRGLKAAMDGRGMLGFRQVAQQTTAPDGISQITIWTDHLLDKPYAGVARRTETRLGPWTNPNAQLLSSTSNIYCDRTSPTPPTAVTVTIDKPCETTSKVTRPYVYKTVEQGTDLTGNPLPTVTTVNTYENNYGDPRSIEVITTGVLAGQIREYKKITTNIFCEPDTAGCPNKISGDNWILGRLTRSTVDATAPNLLSALSTSPGSAANASATQGSLPGGASQPLSPAVLSAIMQLLLED